jgi:hypothetical protein
MGERGQWQTGSTQNLPAGRQQRFIVKNAAQQKTKLGVVSHGRTPRTTGGQVPRISKCLNAFIPVSPRRRQSHSVNTIEKTFHHFRADRVKMTHVLFTCCESASGSRAGEAPEKKKVAKVTTIS